MSFKSLNQKGFSTIEGLLVAVIVLMVAFTGYYVYHTQNQTGTTIDKASGAAQSSPAKQHPFKLSSTLIGDPAKHAQLKVPDGWTATTIGAAGSGHCSFAVPNSGVEDSCLTSINITPNTKAQVSATLKVFQTPDTVSAWRKANLVWCNPATQNINGYKANFCVAGSQQNFSDYVVSDGHYLVDISITGKYYNAMLGAMVHSLKFTD